MIGIGIQYSDDSGKLYKHSVIVRTVEVAHTLDGSIVLAQWSVEFDAIPNARSELSHSNEANDARLFVCKKYFTPKTNVLGVHRGA